MNQKSARTVFPVAKADLFSELQKSALSGDAFAQENLPEMMRNHLQAVYSILDKQGGLLFSVRRLDEGYDRAGNNYAINLDEFFKATTDEVRVKKNHFEIHTKAGAVWPVTYLRYKSAWNALEFKGASDRTLVELSNLTDADRRFAESALTDELFESSGLFEIFSEDSRLENVTREANKVSGIDQNTGEQLMGSFISASDEGFARKIILVNNGNFPVKNLAVEYQSFLDQTVMRMPKDFLSDYRCAGFVWVKSLEPGDRKELEVKLPAVVTARQETVHSGDYEFYRPIPPDLNQRSDGRIKGVWVRVHRFTPYGERLTREYQSSGVPPGEWETVAPSGLDIRK